MALYQKAQVALKRQYLGLFWERFLVEDREIVEAIPSRLIRDLQEKQSVQLGAIGRAFPPTNGTFLDVAYLKSLRERVNAIKGLQRELNIAAH